MIRPPPTSTLFPYTTLFRSLLGDDALVDLAGGEVVALGHPGRDVALVVAEIQVGLRAVVRDEHLAVLERAHRARVDVDVGVHLDQRDLEPARLQEGADRGRGHALAERGHHAASHEDELRLPVLPAHVRPPSSAARARSRSASVSTSIKGSAAVHSTTPIAIPFSSARSCSSCSRRSSGEGGSAAKRRSTSRRYAYMPTWRQPKGSPGARRPSRSNGIGPREK